MYLRRAVYRSRVRSQGLPNKIEESVDAFVSRSDFQWENWERTGQKFSSVRDFLCKGDIIFVYISVLYGKSSSYSWKDMKKTCYGKDFLEIGSDLEKSFCY